MPTRIVSLDHAPIVSRARAFACAMLLWATMTPLAHAGPIGFASTTLPVGGSPSAIATADFNGDGSADLAVTIADLGHVQVLWGNAGSFGLGPTLAVGQNPVDVLTTDVNNEQQLIDLASIN